MRAKNHNHKLPPVIPESGIKLKADTISSARIYAFAYYIWQSIQTWTHDGLTDYKENLKTFSPYLTADFQNILKQEGKKMNSEGFLFKHQQMTFGTNGSGFHPKDVKYIGNGVWLVKNREERLVVLNETAKSVIEGMRGISSDYVFTYRGRRISRILTSAWNRARIRAGLSDIRVHDLKHTFGRRLRAAGISFEDRQDLLGHKSSRITTHYSAGELSNLIKAANKVCDFKTNGSPTLTLLRGAKIHKIPTIGFSGNLENAVSD